MMDNLLNLTKDSLGSVYADGYNKGVKDFAKYLIDKAQNGAVSVLDIVDCAKEWSDNYKNL